MRSRPTGLSFTRKLTVASTALSMRRRSERAFFICSGAGAPGSAVGDLDSFRVDARIALPEDPVEFALTADGKTAAVSSGSAVRLVDLAAQRLGNPLAAGDFGAVRFLSDSARMIAANRGERLLSLYDVSSRA